MMAVPMPANPRLTPLTLSMIARQAIGLGNSVFQLDADALIPVISYTIAGNASPESWRYGVKLPFPNGDNPKDPDDLPVRQLPANRVIHVRYMPGPSAPWHGVSPLIAAGLTASELAKIEQSLEYDASLPSGGILPMPDGVAPATITKAGIGSTLGLARASLALHGDDCARYGPRRQRRRLAVTGIQKRFGAMIPATSINLRDSVTMDILGAMGIPPALRTSQGGALRESYRKFFTATIEPLGALIAAELSAKMGPVELTFPQSGKSDISARSRAFSTFVKAGMEPEDAARISGLPTDFEMVVPEPAPVVPGVNGAVDTPAASVVVST